jgi:hypothetical protein
VNVLPNSATPENRVVINSMLDRLTERWCRASPTGGRRPGRKIASVTLIKARFSQKRLAVRADRRADVTEDQLIEELKNETVARP